MFLWFVGPSILIVWAVFRSPSADYRLVALGSVIPLGELPIGEPRLLHALAGAVMGLAIVMIVARGRRVLQRRWLGVPIGMLLHLVLDGAWTDTDAFWWPFLGVDWSTAARPELGRGAFNLVLEVIGAAACWWGYRRFRLDEPERRADFLRTGRVGRATSCRDEAALLIIVRHGRTEANASGLLLGRRLDPDLDELGRRQAGALAGVLPAARVISSPLRRTRETADALGAPVEVDERWIELDYGELDGTPLAEVPREVWSRWQADPSWAPPGGESLAELGARVREACSAIAEEAAERDVIVVTHVSPVKAALAWALGVGDEISAYVAPASITTIATKGPRPSLHSFNGCTHLDGV